VISLGYITTCRSCGSDFLEDILDFGEQALANGLVISATTKDKKYPLSLVRCSNCHLVQLNYTVPPDILFSNYVWVTSSSDMAIDHSIKFYNTLVLEKLNSKQRKILEIGSNDGTFLKPFKEMGFEVLGVDPAENIAKIANDAGINTICGFFGRDLAMKLSKFDVVIARNVIPHVSNLNEVIWGIKKCLHPKGLAVIEFHYAKTILDELHYDSIYHEHLCYFTVETIETLLNKYGIYIHDIRESPVSGGSLILYCRLYPDGILSRYLNNASKNYISKEDNSLRRWRNFACDTSNHIKKLQDFIAKAKDTYGKVYGYGASARSSTLLNVSHLKLSKIADINPLKQWKFTSGNHIPVVSPEALMNNKPKCICILAWNLSDEIIRTLRDKYNYKGPIIKPLPGDPKYVL